MAKILIVDDSRTSRKVLRGILEEGGHEVVDEAVNGYLPKIFVDSLLTTLYNRFI